MRNRIGAFHSWYIGFYITSALVYCFWACHIFHWVQADRFCYNSTPTSLECFEDFTFTFCWWGWCQNKRINKIKPGKSCSKSIHRNNPIYRFLVKITQVRVSLTKSVNQNVVFFSRDILSRVICVAYLHRLLFNYFIKFTVNNILIRPKKAYLMLLIWPSPIVFAALNASKTISITSSLV